MKLPIELIPNSDPPRFRWTQQVETLIGLSDVAQSGTVPLSIESSLIALIKLCEKQGKEMSNLKEQRDTANRRANAAEILNSNQRQMLDQKQLDKSKPVQVPTANNPAQPISSPKKPKG